MLFFLYFSLKIQTKSMDHHVDLTNLYVFNNESFKKPKRGGWIRTLSQFLKLWISILNALKNDTNYNIKEYNLKI